VNSFARQFLFVLLLVALTNGTAATVSHSGSASCSGTYGNEISCSAPINVAAQAEEIPVHTTGTPDDKIRASFSAAPGHVGVSTYTEVATLILGNGGNNNTPNTQRFGGTAFATATAQDRVVVTSNQLPAGAQILTQFSANVDFSYIFIEESASGPQSAYAYPSLFISFDVQVLRGGFTQTGLGFHIERCIGRYNGAVSCSDPTFDPGSQLFSHAQILESQELQVGDVILQSINLTSYNETFIYNPYVADRGGAATGYINAQNSMRNYIDSAAPNIVFMADSGHDYTSSVPESQTSSLMAFGLITILAFSRARRSMLRISRVKVHQADCSHPMQLRATA
jgi:hypothetical protein